MKTRILTTMLLIVTSFSFTGCLHKYAESQREQEAKIQQEKDKKLEVSLEAIQINRQALLDSGLSIQQVCYTIVSNLHIFTYSERRDCLNEESMKNSIIDQYIQKEGKYDVGKILVEEGKVRSQSAFYSNTSEPFFRDVNKFVESKKRYGEGILRANIIKLVNNDEELRTKLYSWYNNDYDKKLKVALQAIDNAKKILQAKGYETAIYPEEIRRALEDRDPSNTVSAMFAAQAAARGEKLKPMASAESIQTLVSNEYKKLAK